jgi:hypothetical protein
LLYADDVVVNPAETGITGRTEQSLSELGLGVIGADWGESASGQSGSEPKTRTIVLGLVCREDADVDLPTAAYRLQQIVGQMQEEAETWIKRVPKVGGEWAGPGMYRIRRSPTAIEPQVTLSGLGGWQVGENQPVTLTMVADFPFYSTEEDEGETHSALGRHLIYTEPAAKGTIKGLTRRVITNGNSVGEITNGNWRALIAAEECKNAPEELTDPTAALHYSAEDLTVLGGAKVNEGAVEFTKLTQGWVTLLGSEVPGEGHMTHRGGRRPWIRLSVNQETKIRLIWRPLGSSRWTEDNPVVTANAFGSFFQLYDLGSCPLPDAIAGDQRWEWKVQACAPGGSGKIWFLDFYPLPTEQYLVLREPEEEPIDGEPTKAPGTIEDNSGIGTVAWTSPTKAVEDPPGGTTITLAATKVSHYLKATNLGFSSLIPEGVIIKGVRLSFLALAQNASAVFDNRIRIIVGGTIKEFGDQASPFAWPHWEGSERAYGGVGNTFGQSLTRAEVVASNFGFAISIKAPLSENAVRLARLRAAVYYTEGSNESALCFATRSIELASNGCRRQGATADAWAEVVPDGFNFSAMPRRERRGIVIPSRGDLETRPDLPNNYIDVVTFDRAASQVAREAA